jgi:hypothetical protein
LLLLCTNEGLNLGFSNLNHLTRLLHSLPLSRCFSAGQIGKREGMDKLEKYKYPHTPHKPLAVWVKNSFCALIGRTLMLHRTRPVQCPIHLQRLLYVCIQTVTGHTLRLISTHRTHLVVQNPLWKLSGLSPDAPTSASGAASGRLCFLP